MEHREDVAACRGHGSVVAAMGKLSQPPAARTPWIRRWCCAAAGMHGGAAATCRGGAQVIAATNRADILDPALMRSGRLDRKIEFPHPTEDARAKILQIHSRKMNVSPDVNFEELARSTDDFNAAQLKAVCVEAGMLALRRDATEACACLGQGRVVPYHWPRGALGRRAPCLRFILCAWGPACLRCAMALGRRARGRSCSTMFDNIG